MSLVSLLDGTLRQVAQHYCRTLCAAAYHAVSLRGAPAREVQKSKTYGSDGRGEGKVVELSQCYNIIDVSR